MANYEVVFKKSVTRDLRALPREDLRRILSRIRSLADDPRPAGCERLSGKDLYRVRQGDYRVVYAIEDMRLVVMIVKVGHRRDVYRR